jgi:NADPH:quinone reductase-like Zn-dependent oxidoreductase
MKAAVVQGPHQTPSYREFDEPTPRTGSTIVHVAASALSTATRARASGSHYSLAGVFPLVPGVDGVGRTESGTRVGFLLPTAPFGGMAEKTLVPEALCLPVPDNVSDVLAAAIINPGQSPIGALRTRAILQPGETVLINGATGTTGQIAVQIAKHLGAGRVIATGRSSDALARLRELGADDTIDLTADTDVVQDALAAHFADGGIDIVLDYLSGSPTEIVLAACARSHKGAKPVRYVIAGGAAGQSTSVPTSVLGSTSLVLMGSGIGAVRVPDIVSSATEALQMIGSANLQIDLTELPLDTVEKAWTTHYGRSRVVFTI